MKPGQQIAYVPTHVNEELGPLAHLDDLIAHQDTEFGFVTSEKGDAHFCRYWRKGHIGELRTLANSELTPTCNLYEHHSVGQLLVDDLLMMIERDML